MLGPIPRVRNFILFWVVGFYVLFNYGFMQIRFPPSGGTGVPIGEIVLILSLLTINVFGALSHLSKTISLFPFVVWWSLGLSFATYDAATYGMWAFRDASHVIESLFLLVGYAVSVKPAVCEQIFRWLPKVFIAATLYGFGYPFAAELHSLSPKIVAGAGHSVPIFFTYTGTGVAILMFVVYLLVFGQGRSMWRTSCYLIVPIVLAYVAFMFQSRTLYLQIIALMLFLAVMKKELSFKLAVFGVLVAGLLLAITELGIVVHGRFGVPISADFIISHLRSAFGICMPELEGPAAGVLQRLVWWEGLYYRWTRDISTILFGFGFGEPLIDFRIENYVVVREPHNSYVSIVARLGVFGFFAWLWMHGTLIVAWWRGYRASIASRDDEARNRLLFLMAYFLLIAINALPEDAFEKPFYAIPYYFFWGLALRVAEHVRAPWRTRPVITGARAVV